MIKRVLLAGAVLVVGAAALLAVPVTHASERSRWIAAPPDLIAAQLDDLHRFSQWIPLRHRKPETSTFEGPARGAGAVWRWRDDRGEEQMLRVAQSEPGETRYEHSATRRITRLVTLKAERDGTRVTFRHEVELSGWHKLVPLLRSVDSVVGPDLEQDLAALATTVEGKSAAVDSNR